MLFCLPRQRRSTCLAQRGLQPKPAPRNPESLPPYRAPDGASGEVFSRNAGPPDIAFDSVRLAPATPSAPPPRRPAGRAWSGTDPTLTTRRRSRTGSGRPRFFSSASVERGGECLLGGVGVHAPVLGQVLADLPLLVRGEAAERPPQEHDRPLELLVVQRLNVPGQFHPQRLAGQQARRRFRRDSPSNHPASRSAGMPGDSRRDTSRARSSVAITPRSSSTAQAYPESSGLRSSASNSLRSRQPQLALDAVAGVQAHPVELVDRIDQLLRRLVVARRGPVQRQRSPARTTRR